MVGKINSRWEEDDGCCLQGLLVECQIKLTGHSRRGIRVCSWCPSQSWFGGWMPLPWLEPLLSQSMSRRRMKSLPIFTGLPWSLRVSSPTQRYHLEELSLDVGFVLWKVPWARGKGRRGVRPSELPAPPRIWALMGEMAWDSPQILTSPHSSILRP